MRPREGPQARPLGAGSCCALTFGDWKAAALLFDQVFPYQLISYERDWAFAETDAYEWGRWAHLHPTEDGETASQIWQDLVPADALSALQRDLGLYRPGNWSLVQELQRSVRGYSLHDAEYIDVPIRNVWRQARRDLQTAYMQNWPIPSTREPFRDSIMKLGTMLGLSFTDVLLDDRLEVEAAVQASQARTHVRFENLRLVDTAEVTWDQVLGFRQDPNSTSAMKRFRTFFRANYEGKSLSCVEDDVSSRVEEYERACRRHGMRVALSVLDQFLSSPGLLAGGAGSIVCIAMGKTLEGLLSIGGGVAVEVARIGISLARSEIDYRESVDAHPIAYLSKVRNSLTCTSDETEPHRAQ